MWVLCEGGCLGFVGGDGGGVGVDCFAGDDGFVRPADGVKAPVEQIGADGFLAPALGAIAVFRLPAIAGFGIAEGRRVDVVEGEAEKGAAFGSGEPPAAVALGQREIGRRRGPERRGGGLQAGAGARRTPVAALSTAERWVGGGCGRGGWKGASMTKRAPALCRFIFPISPGRRTTLACGMSPRRVSGACSLR